MSGEESSLRFWHGHQDKFKDKFKGVPAGALLGVSLTVPLMRDGAVA